MKACKPVTEKIKQSEVLRMKGTLKRVMSGVLSVITIASAVAQPIESKKFFLDSSDYVLDIYEYRYHCFDIGEYIKNCKYL